MHDLRPVLIAVATAIGTGCSAPETQPPASPASEMTFATHAANFATPDAAQQHETDLKPPQFCHVSLDCMELDSRPFEPCYANGKPCEGEGGFMKAAPQIIFQSIEPMDIGPLPASPPKE